MTIDGVSPTGEGLAQEAWLLLAVAYAFWAVLSGRRSRFAPLGAIDRQLDGLVTGAGDGPSTHTTGSRHDG